MRMRFLYLVFLLFSMLPGAVKSQTKVAAALKDSVHYIQMTGVVISDSMYRVPFTRVIDLTTNRGVIADYYGYYAIIEYYTNS